MSKAFIMCIAALLVLVVGDIIAWYWLKPMKEKKK